MELNDSACLHELHRAGDPKWWTAMRRNSTAADAAVPAATRVALLLAGELGSTKRGRPPILTTETVVSMVSYVIEPLRSNGSVNSFLCISPSDEQPSSDDLQRLGIVATLIEETWPRTLLDILEINANWRHADTSSTFVQARLHRLAAKANRTIAMWRRTASCYRAALRHEHGTQYTHFIRARPDLVFYASIPPLASLDAGAVAVRARQLHGGHRPFSVSRDHLVSPVCSHFFYHHCRERHYQCLTIDDQWAVVPRHLGTAYFEHTYDPHDPQDVRRAWAAFSGQATAESWRHAGQLGCEPCLRPSSDWYLPESLLTDEFVAYGDPLAPRAPRDLGWILPFQIAPFRFHIHPGVARLSVGVISDDSDTLAEASRPKDFMCA